MSICCGCPHCGCAPNDPDDACYVCDACDAYMCEGDDFALGPQARDLAVEAEARGKHVHMGRVNSQRRWSAAWLMGCDSADGTFLTFGPDANLPRLLRWQGLEAVS